MQQVSAALAANRFVPRTGVKSYCASIGHMLLLDRLEIVVPDRNILDLVWQYPRCTAERGGCFWGYERGISLGCPLSPLIGAFFLDELDRRMAATGLFYDRFMEDILALAPSQWKLRRAWKSIRTKRSSTASNGSPIFWATGSRVGCYGSRGKRSGVTRHGCIGFMSNRGPRPMARLLWMPT